MPNIIGLGVLVCSVFLTIPGAQAQRIIAYDEAYLVPLPERYGRVEGRAELSMSAEDRALVTLEPEAGLPFTLGRFRIQAPVGEIVHNVALATLNEAFSQGAAGHVATAGASTDAIIVHISGIDFGYNYRQPHELGRPEGSLLGSSTPSASISMRLTFSRGDEVLYDTGHAPFAPENPECPSGLDCSYRIFRATRLGQPQSGVGNSKEVVNRALHEAIHAYVLIFTCEFMADQAARSQGARLTEKQAENCAYPGYQLLPSPADANAAR